MDQNITNDVAYMRHFESFVKSRMTYGVPTEETRDFEQENYLIGEFRARKVKTLQSEYHFYRSFCELVEQHRHFLSSNEDFAMMTANLMDKSYHKVILGMIDNLHSITRNILPSTMPRFYEIWYNTCYKQKKGKKADQNAKGFETLYHTSLRYSAYLEQQQAQELSQFQLQHSNDINGQTFPSPPSSAYSPPPIPTDFLEVTLITPDDASHEDSTTANAPSTSGATSNAGLLGRKRSHSGSRSSDNSNSGKSTRLSTEIIDPSMNVTPTEMQEILQQFVEEYEYPMVSNPEGSLSRSSLVYDNSRLNTQEETETNQKKSNDTATTNNNVEEPADNYQSTGVQVSRQIYDASTETNGNESDDDALEIHIESDDNPDDRVSS